MSKTITLSVPDDTYKAMREFPEINYSELARQRINEYLATIKDRKSPNPFEFLALKDTIFTREKIVQIHDQLEKNRKQMSELSWIHTVFDLDLFDSLTRFLFLFPRTHPFEDGNKRTAFVCVDAFLRLNFMKLKIEQPTQKTTEDAKFFWQNANQQKTEKQIKEFLQKHITPCKRPASAQKAISDSITENKALLEDLAR